MKKFHTKFDRLNLNLLRVFEVIYRERNLTRAAQVLSLTPSAISHSLRQLRDFYEDPLFERDGTHMTPTSFCAALAPDLLHELARLRDVVQRWGRFDPATTTALFTVAMPEPIEAVLLPSLVQHFAGHAPRAHIASTGNDRRTMTNNLERGEIDMAIDVLLAPQPQLQRRLLARSGWCVVARREHPFIHDATIEGYRAAGHVTVSSRAFGAVLEDTHLDSLQIERETVLRCQNYFNAMEVVRHSDLILTMPRQLWVEADLAMRGLDIVDLSFDLPDIALYAYWHSHHETDQRNAWLRETIAARFDTVIRSGNP